ncbi:MAG: type II secretion system protein [Planctomycetaceae bacterium]
MKRRTIRIPTPGFTVIEMLIVVLIMAILMTLVVPMIADVLGTSRRAATRATIKKISELLQKRQDAFARKFPDYYRATWGRDFRPANATHVMRRKAKYREMFLLAPMRGALGTIPPTSTPRPILSAADSAEVLYFLVTESETFGTIAADRGEFATGEIGDTDKDGRKEFVDGWGRPIRYYLYPTRLFKPNGHSTTAANGGVARGAYPAYKILFRSALSPRELDSDPDDRLFVLQPNDYRERPANSTPPVNYTRFFHTFGTYHVPLIVSAGGDGVLGLYEPGDIANFGHLAKPKPADFEGLHDNISNHNLTAGGK